MKDELAKVQEVLDLDLNDISNSIQNLSTEDKDTVLSKIINNQLKQLKESLTMDIYSKISRDVDNITDFYASSKTDFDAVVEEGDSVANDILFKVIGCGNRNFELPVDISIIKKYCFSTEIKEEQVYDTLIWMALRYIAISQSISYFNWKQTHYKEISSN